MPGLWQAFQIFLPSFPHPGSAASQTVSLTWLSPVSAGPNLNKPLKSQFLKTSRSHSDAFVAFGAGETTTCFLWWRRWPRGGSLCKAGEVQGTTSSLQIITWLLLFLALPYQQAL